jgi:hypothetical protein
LRNLTLGDVKLALHDLLGEKLELLRLSATGRQYEPRLRAKQKQIEAIPEPQGSQAPLARELAEADVLHDGFGAAIFYLCRAIEAHPTLPLTLKEAAREVHETFVPELDVLRAPYADEASAALDNRPELAKLKAELKSIATPDGRTLYDWVKAFLAAGDTIGKHLRERANLLAKGENAAASGPLRGATVGLLGRFRDALGDELEDEETTLPAKYPTQLFAYVDKLNADRERALRDRPAQAKDDAPPPADEPAAPAAEEPAAAKGRKDTDM